MWIFKSAISTGQAELQFVKVPKVAILTFSAPMIIHHLPNKATIQLYFLLLKYFKRVHQSRLFCFCEGYF